MTAEFYFIMIKGCCLNETGDEELHVYVPFRFEDEQLHDTCLGYGYDGLHDLFDGWLQTHGRKEGYYTDEPLPLFNEGSAYDRKWYVDYFMDDSIVMEGGTMFKNAVEINE